MLVQLPDGGLTLEGYCGGIPFPSPPIRIGEARFWPTNLGQCLAFRYATSTTPLTGELTNHAGKRRFSISLVKREFAKQRRSAPARRGTSSVSIRAERAFSAARSRRAVNSPVFRRRPKSPRNSVTMHVSQRVKPATFWKSRKIRDLNVSGLRFQITDLKSGHGQPTTPTYVAADYP
jgi:hypothetical protein